MASLWRLLALGLSLALAAAQTITPLDTRGQLQVGSPLYSLDLDPEPYDDRVKLHLYPSTSNLYAPDDSLKVISFFSSSSSSSAAVVVLLWWCCGGGSGGGVGVVCRLHSSV